MHARMQYDVHLSDLYSTDKLVIYSAKLNKLADFEDGASYWKAKYVVICLIINEEKNTFCSSYHIMLVIKLLL